MLPSQCVPHHDASKMKEVALRKKTSLKDRTLRNLTASCFCIIQFVCNMLSGPAVRRCLRTKSGKVRASSSNLEKGNHWPAWYSQLLSPAFLCVLLWNSIGTIKFSAKTLGLILLETVLGQCGRFRRSWCSRKRGAHAETIPTSAGCNGLCSFRLRFTIFFMFMALGALHSLTLQELKRSDEMRYLENQQVIFRLLLFGIMLSISIGSIYFISYRFYLVLVWLLSKLFSRLGCLLASADVVVVRLSQLLSRYHSSPCKQARRRGRRPSERRRSHREILYWLVAFLLLLAFFKVRPPECIDSRKAHLLGGYFNHERTSYAS